MRRRFALALVVLFGAAGAFVGLVAAGVGNFDSWQRADVRLAEYHPLPHRVPKSPAAVSFRFAMAHDVLHERYPKSGTVRYEARTRIARERLAKLAPDDSAAFALMDDLGVGLDRVGHPDEAVALLHDKLVRQHRMSVPERERYTTYANLGTFLVHANLDKATTGDSVAVAKVREGVQYLKQAIEVNPDAHFGREQWQVVITEFLLAAVEKPEVLKEFDFIGDRLGRPASDFRDRELVFDYKQSEAGYGRAYRWHHYFWSEMLSDRRSAIDEVSNEPSADETGRRDWWERVKWYREYVTHVGAEGSWVDAPVPFDEPMLGIIGMWRQGGGANPHFALCVGETMLRVGQRFIAWAAFERAARLADRFWPSPELQQFLREHCARRQAEIEATLKPGEAAELRPRFDAELAYGLDYQRAYQEHEAAKLAAGADPFNLYLHDDFSREPIASTPGPEEWYARPSEAKWNAEMKWRTWSFTLFGAGLGAALAALCAWVANRPWWKRANG